ncbi:nitrate ABC transporter permease [Tistrella mobilis]|uniref:Nitrate ABC transporter, inner membrane subunit n=1 Tax=Tistrella mobilis (strain KA081020-065) TaxID=1110502 RepID=I3TMJ6_TISMK|nr:nitrate ABC transporter permease [Tistrella mobilis]AFK53984.1 nitrate ABC transporter, inner membrane subunit [Tistrella mobilis KA081020-065]
MADISLDGAAKTGTGIGRRLGLVAERIVWPLLTLAVALGGWTLIQQTVATDLPGVGETLARGIELFSDPFYIAGPNDQGIFWQLLYSLGRVLAGFGLACLIGLPMGLLIGTSQAASRAFTPFIEVMRPVSPLAWLPIGLLLFRAVDPSAIFVILITSIWPVILNTAAGVRAVPADYVQVGRVLRLGRLAMFRRILLPAALPYVLAGMRLSLGTAWMVIVAAEMLTGGVGIGFFIWDEWNNLSVPSILVAIVLIGLVGIALDAAMAAVQRRLSH